MLKIAPAKTGAISLFSFAPYSAVVTHPEKMI